MHIYKSMKSIYIIREETPIFAPVLEVSGSRRLYPLKCTSVDRVYVVFGARVDLRFFTIRQKRIRGGGAFAEGTLSWTAGDRKARRGRERAWKDGGGEGGSKGGETSREVSCGGHWPVFIHKPSHNAALALETLVLQMTNSHAINNILSIVMHHSVLFDRWLT